MKQPAKKQYVEVLMRYVREELRIIGRESSTPRNVPYVLYECPNRDNCKNANGLVAFQKHEGFTNPFNHLLACYKQKEDIFTEVRRQLASQTEQGSGPSTQGLFEQTGSDREKALFAYIQLIVFCNAPITCVENDYHRQFSKYVVNM